MGRNKHNRDKHSWFYLIGRGYVWRVNCYGMFQRGDTIEDFDRWALCDIYEEDMPTTKKKFSNFVKRALSSE